MHVCVCKFVCICAYNYWRKPEEGMSFPRAGAGRQTSVLWKAASVLNHCATSEALEHFFFQKLHRKELDCHDDGETEI